MLSPGPSQGALPSAALEPAAPVCERGTLHLQGSELGKHELDGHALAESSASAPLAKPSTAEFQEHMSGKASLEPIPEIPTISVSAVTEESQTTNRGIPPTSKRLSAAPRPKSTQPTAAAPASSWWKRGLGMAFTGDSARDSVPDSDARKSKIGTWWTGDSAASSARSSRMLTTAPTATAPAAAEVAAITRLRKSHTVAATPEKASAMSSISSMISRLTTTQSVPLPDDELCTMDLEAALPPPATPAPTPEDYHALHIQTLTLLSRFQEAYVAQSATLLDLQAERSAERDEAAQVATRARHLRSQLDDVLARAGEQEAAMAAALEELGAEKRARLEAERKAPSAEGSVVTEDLAAEEDQRRDGDETDEESIFSRSRSPTLAEGDPASPPRSRNATLAEGDTAPSPARARLPPRPGPAIRRPAPQPQPRLSAFQKIVRGIAGEEGDGRCANCRGGEAGAAWDTVSLLRDENRGLKQRVGALEVAVEGALDVVNGVGM